MSKKKKNIINSEKTISFLVKAYGLHIRQMNDYQFRISHDEFDGFFDWYHTTGSTVVARRYNGEMYQRRFGTFVDEEELALAINNHVYECERNNGTIN